MFLRKWSNGPYFFATFSWKCWGKDNRKQRNQHSNPEYFMVNLLQVADSNGTTLLHVAARAGSFQVVKASSIGVVVHGTETGKKHFEVKQTCSQFFLQQNFLGNLPAW